MLALVRPAFYDCGHIGTSQRWHELPYGQRRRRTATLPDVSHAVRLLELLPTLTPEPGTIFALSHEVLRGSAATGDTMAGDAVLPYVDTVASCADGAPRQRTTAFVASTSTGPRAALRIEVTMMQTVIDGSFAPSPTRPRCGGQGVASQSYRTPATRK